jgi:hypothetical protein
MVLLIGEPQTGQSPEAKKNFLHPEHRYFQTRFFALRWRTGCTVIFSSCATFWTAKSSE